jgi:hypothetical protein
MLLQLSIAGRDSGIKSIRCRAGGSLSRLDDRAMDSMKMLRILTLMFGLLPIVAGCATTGERFTELEPGMSKAQVIRIVGRPDGYRRAEEQEALIYKDRLISGWAWDRADHAVLLRDGRVVEYGAGEVRQHGPNVGVLIFVPLR